ncbi:MAG: DUF6141 family protein [Pseudomonadales bacterium]|nr:DUF6141 family protein [Pseudomonadales bacterium]
MQPNEALYAERQRFRQWWIWLLVLIGPVVSLWAIFQQLVMGSPFGNNPAPDYVLVVLVIIVGGGLPLFMYSTGLDTEVRDCGVCIRFRPFHRKWVVFGFGSIQKAEACTYSPLRDYGGWGIRYGRKGKAYNVSGNKGVMLVLSDGKSVLIGSGNHEILCSAIKERLQ